MVVRLHKFEHLNHFGLKGTIRIDLINTAGEMKSQQCRHLSGVQPFIKEVLFGDVCLYQRTDLTLFEYCFVFGCDLSHLFHRLGLRHLQVAVVLLQPPLYIVARAHFKEFVVVGGGTKKERREPPPSKGREFKGHPQFAVAYGTVDHFGFKGGTLAYLQCGRECGVVITVGDDKGKVKQRVDLEFFKELFCFFHAVYSKIVAPIISEILEKRGKICQIVMISLIPTLCVGCIPNLSIAFNIFAL